MRLETHAGPHDQRNGKARGEDATDSEERSERGGGGRGLRPEVERENRRNGKEEGERRGQYQC